MLLAWGKKTIVSVTSENNERKTAAPPASGASYLYGDETPQGSRSGETKQRLEQARTAALLIPCTGPCPLEIPRCPVP